MMFWMKPCLDRFVAGNVFIVLFFVFYTCQSVFASNSPDSTGFNLNPDSCTWSPLILIPSENTRFPHYWPMMYNGAEGNLQLFLWTDVSPAPSTQYLMFELSRDGQLVDNPHRIRSRIFFPKAIAPFITPDGESKAVIECYDGLSVFTLNEAGDYVAGDLRQNLIGRQGRDLFLMNLYVRSDGCPFLLYTSRSEESAEVDVSWYVLSPDGYEIEDSGIYPFPSMPYCGDSVLGPDSLVYMVCTCLYEDEIGSFGDLMFTISDLSGNLMIEPINFTQHDTTWIDKTHYSNGGLAVDSSGWIIILHTHAITQSWTGDFLIKIIEPGTYIVYEDTLLCNIGSISSDAVTDVLGRVHVFYCSSGDNPILYHGILQPGSSTWLQQPVALDFNFHRISVIQAYSFPDEYQIVLAIAGKMETDVDTRVYMAFLGDTDWDSLEYNQYSEIDSTRKNEVQLAEFCNIHLYPNPFNSTLHVNCRLEKTTNIKCDIYNILGQYETTIIDGIYNAGNNYFSWYCGSSLSSSGTYIAVVTIGKYVVINKVIFIK